ncbi:hypothetical protein [Cohnella cholangitidis]|uniref:Uncharacterized protein n=1 Tax=Cohnella cholangitidis TaxID=2598458 RepID=A0A7G5BYG7_9BACL|nr:hypothetical protein [Cohnella cholangitidis]QMV42001.1 hypothetical protein FPL14_12955 [Cohnella cholangitidis]
MKWRDRYEKELAFLFAEAAAETARFPEPFNEIGLALLAKANPQDNSAGTNYITFLLPYWLKERIAESSDILCRDLAIGNIFAMLHYFLMDDVMDLGAESNNKVGVREALVLGQLYQVLFQQRYGRHFAAESPVWQDYRRYMEVWGVAVSQENKQSTNPYDPGRLAAKSAPVKLCAAAMLLSAGRRESLPELEAAIDLVLATLQLADDWKDWRDDLAEESCNAFLTLVRQRISLPPDQPLDERKVKQGIYRANALDHLLEISEGYGRRLVEISDVPLSLVDFQQTLTEEIRRDARLAEEMTFELASGGSLSYFLSKISKK